MRHPGDLPINHFKIYEMISLLNKKALYFMDIIVSKIAEIISCPQLTRPSSITSPPILIGIYELNNVSLLRELYVDAYLASAERYKTLRAEVDVPEKAAVAYRDFVKEAVRRCVLEWKSFDADNVMGMAAESGIPEEERKQVVEYVGAQFRGLHEGNAIRYRLRPGDLAGLDRNS